MTADPKDVCYNQDDKTIPSQFSIPDFFSFFKSPHITCFGNLRKALQYTHPGPCYFFPKS